MAAINETYRVGGMGPWARFVEASFEADVVLEPRGGAFTDGVWKGHEGAVQFVANAMGVLDDMWIRADEIIDVSDERLIVLTSFGGRAPHTRMDVDNSIANVLGMRAGKVASWWVFQNREQALEAVGPGP